MSALQMQQAFHEARNGGIIEYVTRIRENPEQKYRVSRIAIDHMFESLPLWERVNQGGGHRTYKHVLTGIVVGFQNHKGGRLGSEIDPGQAVELRDQLQEHLNILGNEIFKFQTRSWKDEPNYQQAARNLVEWRTNRRAGGKSS